MSCNDLINDSDIKIIYESCRCVDQASVRSHCHNTDTKVTNINLTKGEATINKKPIQREYHRNAPLRSIDSNGKVVINKLFVLKDAYRGSKITDKFHNKEMEIYHRNDFIEIQLDAAWNGITHWAELGFDFYKLTLYHQQLYTLWSSFFMKSFVLAPEKKLDILTK